MRYVRLKKNSDFIKVYKKGKRVFSPCLTVIYYPAQGAHTMGLSVGKSHGNAVRRNRLKRQLRAAYSENLDILGGSYTVIIRPKPAEEYSYKDISEGLKACFKRINKCGGKAF